MSKGTWVECSIEVAFDFAQGKKIKKKSANYYRIQSPDNDADIVLFTDGSAVACVSSWAGPYSVLTPDVDAEPPKWWYTEKVEYTK